MNKESNSSLKSIFIVSVVTTVVAIVFDAKELLFSSGFGFGALFVILVEVNQIKRRDGGKANHE